MTFWSNGRLRAANNSIISDFSEDRLDCNSYRLRMGDCYYRTQDIDSRQPQTKLRLGAKEQFVIPAGQFAYLLSKETVKVPPDAMAFISMSTRIKFRGIINVSGFHVDPGYEGKLLYAVYNASPSPIPICEDDTLFKIWFCDIGPGKKVVFNGDVVTDIPNDLIQAMSRPILSLQSLGEKITTLENRMEVRLQAQQETINNLNFIWRAIIIGVIVAVVVAFVNVTSQQKVTHGPPVALSGATKVQSKTQ